MLQLMPSEEGRLRGRGGGVGGERSSPFRDPLWRMACGYAADARKFGSWPNAVYAASDSAELSTRYFIR
jgi:hypothetical protein